MNLRWSHIHKLNYPAISPGMYSHCDMAHVIDPPNRSKFDTEDKKWDHIPQNKTILSLDTIVKPYSLSHLFPFGTYRLAVLVAAANVKPIKETIEITLTGDWYDDEDQMLSEGVGVRML